MLQKETISKRGSRNSAPATEEKYSRERKNSWQNKKRIIDHLSEPQQAVQCADAMCIPHLSLSVRGIGR